MIDALRLLPARTLLSDRVDLVPMHFAGLTPDRLRQAGVHLVAAPLVANGYDILDVIGLARNARYMGTIAALTRPVALPGDLRPAIRERAHGLTVYIVQVDVVGDMTAVDCVTG